MNIVLFIGKFILLAFIGLLVFGVIRLVLDNFSGAGGMFASIMIVVVVFVLFTETITDLLGSFRKR